MRIHRTGNAEEARRPMVQGIVSDPGRVRVVFAPGWWGLIAVVSLPTGLFAIALGWPFLYVVTLSVSLGLALIVVALGHEVGHAVAGAKLGVQPEEIRLFALGAATSYRAKAPSPRAKALTAVAGPTVNVLVGTVALGLARALDHPGLNQFLLVFAAMNLAIAALNLLPVLPQDGGQVLYALLWRLSGDEPRALLAASVFGFGLLAIALSLVVRAALGQWQLAAALVPGTVQLAFMLRANWRAIRAAQPALPRTQPRLYML